MWQLKKKVEEIVYDLSKPVVDRQGFELVDVEYLKEGSDWYLRIYIDKDGGIAIDDCKSVSEEISDLLDEIDPIDHTYIFEVSSPGIERPLKNERDYIKSLNKEVEVKFYKPFDGKKTLEGLLIGYTDKNVTIDINGKQFDINKEIIALIKPLIKF